MDEKMRDRAEEIRDFNRFYTNIIGLVNRHILESPYSLAEARVLLEIDAAGSCTARDLTRRIDIDPGYLSRMLSKFMKNGLVAQSVSSADGRAKILSLTGKGRDAYRHLSESSNLQIRQMLEQFPERDQKKLLDSMQTIRSILSHQVDNTITIRTRRAGDLGYIAYRHAILYEEEYGLKPVFEQYVMDGLLAFQKSQAEGEIWIAESGGKVVGFIGVVASDSETAQLRWFLIEPEFRGLGLGRRLMTTAMDFCREKGFRHVFLWTFDELDAARHLYREYGFLPTERTGNDIWKDGVVEERWDLALQ